MLEIEAKARIDSLKLVEKRIIDLGAVFHREVIENDTYYNHPCRDFSKTDEALRIRKSQGVYELTYKGQKIDSLTKTRSEHTVEIKNPSDASQIIESLGFERVASVNKKRRYFKLERYEIMLDNVDGLGTFMEVETSGNYSPDKLLNFIHTLGIEETETKSYLELLLEKQK